VRKPSLISRKGDWGRRQATVVHSLWIQVIQVSFSWIELKSLILAQI